jgi:hypothetical protein
LHDHGVEEPRPFLALVGASLFPRLIDKLDDLVLDARDGDVRDLVVGGRLEDALGLDQVQFHVIAGS